MPLALQIKEKARQLGFFRCGVARAEPLPGLHFLENWIKEQKHGDMAWIERTKEKRQDPSLVLPGVKSIIMAGMNYVISDSPEIPEGVKISRYAWGEDYHTLMEDKLKQLMAFVLSLVPSARARVYADTGPVMEKPWAQKAGMGWIGKHTNLISTGHGSYLFLGALLIDQEMAYDDPGIDLCGQCSLCIEACPTGALTSYVLDATKCISYLTIEKKGEIPETLKAGLGAWIYGCDDCQDVCPWNAAPQTTEEPHFKKINPFLKELSLKNLDEAHFNPWFKKSPIKRIKFKGLFRNLQIAQENREALNTPSG
ncbi:MAG: tRNA epoxyqueuosine(34) reductase QueG [Nitrospirae bacterium]|nr:tRNA epoxyqueuosine(34) reductase QueG [Nitrospirota bacterium]